MESIVTKRSIMPNFKLFDFFIDKYSDDKELAKK